MKKIIFSIVVGMMLVFTPLASAMEFNKLIIKTDRFTGETSKEVYVDTIKSIHTEFRVLATSVADNLYLTLLFKSESWEYLRCNSVNFLIDGKRLSPNTKYDGRVYSGYVIEYIQFYNEDVRIILEGTDVEFKICNDEYRIPTEQLKLLRQVLK